jgi:deazaflavin-dependent oxidoreductase (nitroreductase family)
MAASSIAVETDADAMRSVQPVVLRVGSALKSVLVRPPAPLIEIGAWMLENGHRALLKASGGRFPRRVLGMQPVELHHVGRSSGRPRSTMLTAPLCEEHQVVLVASKGGHPEHPDWYKNLVVNPDVELVVNDERRVMRARTASPEEKAALWPRIVSAYKAYDSYQRNTDRDIPVVILEPRT